MIPFMKTAPLKNQHIKEAKRFQENGKERKGKGAKALTPKEKASLIAQLEQEMKEASRRLEFEYAAILRDQIIELRGASETG